MSISKEELEQTARQYHQQDILEDKHIEGAGQAYTFNWVFSQIGNAAHVLEMGYGDGLFSAELSKRNIHFTLIEGAASLVETARKMYPQTVTEHVLFEEYTSEEKFDVILATHVLEHVDNPVSLLKNMYSWLKPGGKLIVIVPNKESIHRKLAVLMGLQPALDTLGARDKLVGHQRVYSLDTLSADIREAGFSITDQQGFFLKVLPNSMMREYSSELIYALNEISPELPPHLLANIGIAALKK